MTKTVLNTIASRYGSLDALNANFDEIELALDNTLSRDGTAPNAMEADLDMNSKSILNVNSLDVSSLVLNGVQVTTGSSFTIAGFTVHPIVTASAGQTVFSVSPATIAVSSLIMVYVNGIKLRNNETSFLGSDVTIPAMAAGDEVEIVELKIA